MEIHQKQNGLRQKHGKRPFCRKNINSPSRNGKGNLASQSVLDARNAAPARSFRHSLRYGLAHARVKRRRQNVILIQFVPADQPRNGIGCRALHLVVDVAGPHIKRAAEDAGERQARCSPGSGNRSGRWPPRAAPPAFASSGKISGVGLAQANRIASFAMVLTISVVTRARRGSRR